MSMKKIIVKAAMAISGKTQEQLAHDWSVHHFLTRSRAKAYWRAVFA